ncbi:MAG: substrate-binding domain-containing protein [Desulfobacterales bacterium]|nr:substrate-binding domain-containing protein [Desulfobacterales bacterium]
MFRSIVVCFFLLNWITYVWAEKPDQDFKNKWVALIIEYTSSDYNQRLIKGAQEEAKTLGLRLEILDAKNNKAAMPFMIDDVTLRNVDGIMISHGAPNLLLPSLKRSLRRDIPVVAIHCDIELPGVSLLSQDDGLIAEMIMKEMIADTNGRADFVLIWIGGYEPMEKRIDVYNKIMAEEPGLREITRFGIAGPGTVLHTEVRVKEILQSYPKDGIDAVLATWDEYAKGAANAIMSEGRNEIRLYGIDISDSVLKMLKNPDNPWVATVGVDSKMLGRVQIRMLAQALLGRKLPDRHTLEPVLINKSMLPEDQPVTMSDLHQYIPGWEKNLTEFKLPSSLTPHKTKN